MQSSEMSQGETAPHPGPVDAEEFARLAAEVVAMIEHHRAELRAAVDELTALQRTVRTEIRDAIHELDAIAAGRPEAVGATDPEPTADATPGSSRRLRRRR